MKIHTNCPESHKFSLRTGRGTVGYDLIIKEHRCLFVLSDPETDGRFSGQHLLYPTPEPVATMQHVRKRLYPAARAALAPLPLSMSQHFPLEQVPVLLHTSTPHTHVWVTEASWESDLLPVKPGCWPTDNSKQKPWEAAFVWSLLMNN